MENKEKIPKELKAWEKEKKLIQMMISKYCHSKHGTKRKDLCDDCRELTEYSLFRLEKCPFKKNKKFCSFCKIHCYKLEMREKIKDVMKYAGPRMLLAHPIFSVSHVVQMVRNKKTMKAAEKTKDITENKLE